MPCFFAFLRASFAAAEVAVWRRAASDFSSSKLLESDVPDGVVEPVRAGDCIGDSLVGDAVISPLLACAFSPPVIASEMARRPTERGFLKKECEEVWAAGDGEARPVDDVSLPGMWGEFATASMLCESYVSLVTVGFDSFIGFRGRTKSKVPELW